jgi:hypothetical protein
MQDCCVLPPSQAECSGSDQTRHQVVMLHTFPSYVAMYNIQHHDSENLVLGVLHCLAGHSGARNSIHQRVLQQPHIVALLHSSIVALFRVF